MFALFAFGSLFGFIGLLVAVPLAAALGVLLRFAIRKYEPKPWPRARRRRANEHGNGARGTKMPSSRPTPQPTTPVLSTSRRGRLCLVGN